MWKNTCHNFSTSIFFRSKTWKRTYSLQYDKKKKKEANPLLLEVGTSECSSIVYNCFITLPFMGSLFFFCCFFLLEPIPAVSGRGQGTTWTSLQLMAGHFTDGKGCHASCQSGAIWTSLSCSRTLRHAAQLSPELGFEPTTFRVLADLLYPLSYSCPDFRRFSHEIINWSSKSQSVG